MIYMAKKKPKVVDPFIHGPGWEYFNEVCKDRRDVNMAFGILCEVARPEQIQGLLTELQKLRMMQESLKSLVHKINTTEKNLDTKTVNDIMRDIVFKGEDYFTAILKSRKPKTKKKKVKGKG